MSIIQKPDRDEALYEQLMNTIRAQIADGSLSVGARLPSEAQLADDFDMSRGTVRHALEVLVNEGLIERIHGSGSYVKEPSRPDHAASNRTASQIGLVLSHLSDQLNMEIMRGVEHGAKSRGYQLIVTWGEDSAEQQRQNVLRLLENEATGLIVFPIGENPEQEGITQVMEARTPFVLVDRYFPSLDTDWVVADNRSGGYRATEHLLILGHRRIGFVYSAPPNSLNVTSVGDRWRGYRQALETYGLPYDDSLVYQLPVTATEFYNYEPLLTLPNRPSAIFAATDYQALRVIKAAQRVGLRVPEDLGVVGFDDLSFSSLLTPPLTTVAQMRMDLGLRAVNLLLDRIEGLAGPAQHVELPTNLIIRESCGARLQVQRSLSGVS